MSMLIRSHIQQRKNVATLTHNPNKPQGQQWALVQGLSVPFVGGTPEECERFARNNGITIDPIQSALEKSFSA